MEVGSSCRVAPRTSTRGIPASETGREKSVGASIRRPMTSSVFCLESFSRQKLLFTLETFSSTLLLLGISISDFSSNVSGFTNRIITILCILYFPFALFFNSDYNNERLSKSLRKFLFVNILKKCEQINTRKNYNSCKTCLNLSCRSEILQHLQTGNIENFSTTYTFLIHFDNSFSTSKIHFFFFGQIYNSCNTEYLFSFSVSCV